jgi:molybdate transport system regulatory protein
MQSPRFNDALGHGPGDKRIDILRGIHQRGSISQAARDAAVSYKAAWQAIDTLTQLAGVALVTRSVGGVGGGGASLTPDGLHLLDLAAALDAAKEAVRKRWEAGEPAALDATAVMQRTSMRNHLVATITAIERLGRASRVCLQVGQGTALCARITHRSVESLGLHPGMQVIALYKAIAVRVEAAEATGALRARAGSSALSGKVCGMERSDEGDEVWLEPLKGVRVVGFARPGSGLRLGRRAVAIVDESDVVISLP